MHWLRTFCAILPLLAGSAAWAQADCPPAPTPAAMRADALSGNVRDRGLLWRLEKDGRTSWLYGTVHVNRADWALPGPRIVAALSDSDVVALELDPSDPALAQLLLSRGDLAREARVVQGLQPRIRTLAARACLPPDRIATLRPLFQLMMLSLHEGRRGGFHPEFSVDAVLFGMAQRLGKSFVPLETAAAQMAALVPESEADERVLMERGVQDLETGDNGALLARMLQAWSRSDEAGLASYPEWCRCLDTPAERRFFRRLNDERNGPMADKIDTLHAGGRRVFAAVGALHMTGPDALPVLLRARGFRVQRIPFEPTAR